MAPVDIALTDGKKTKFVIPAAIVGAAVVYVFGYADLKADVRQLKETRVQTETLATKSDVEAVQKRVDEIYRLLAQRDR